MSKKNTLIVRRKVSKPKRQASPLPEAVRADQTTPAPEKFLGPDAEALTGGMESLRTPDERYRLLQRILQSTSDGILAVNRDNEVLFANERFAEMWKIPQEIMASKDDTLLLQYALDQLCDPQGFLQKVQELYGSSEESFDTLYFKNGRVFERLSRPIMQDENRPGRVWSFRDITERKLVEEAVAEERNLLLTMIENLPDRIYVKDIQGRKIISNTADWRAAGGKRMQDVIGKTDFDTYPAELAARFWDHDKMVLSGKPVINLEEPSLDSQGNPILTLTTKVPLRDDKGQIMGLVGIGRDITERKRVEEALAASEAELRALFSSMQDAVMVIDREGVYRKIAPTNPNLLVRPPEELLGKNLKDVFSAEKAEASRQVIQQVLDTKQNTQIEYELLINGRTTWFQTTISPLDADNTLWVAHDITERKQVEEELRRAKDDLETVLLKLQESLERETLLANTDGLTGLCNHRHFFELAARELQAAVRYQHPLAFIMFDIDHFKQFNDTLGHTAGDKLLVEVAQTAVAQVRASDLVGRYGGDEFIALLPYASAQQALAVAERIRASVAGIHVEPFRDDKEPFTVTLSIGIAEMRPEPVDDNVERIIQRADDALYEAKQSGRNCVVIFRQDEL